MITGASSSGQSLPVYGARTDTHCPYCALQCGMEVTRVGDSFEVNSRDFPTNRGGLCKKGWTSAELLTTDDRLSAPLLRSSRGEALRPVSWEEAIGYVADAIRKIQASHGPDAESACSAAVGSRTRRHTRSASSRAPSSARNISIITVAFAWPRRRWPARACLRDRSRLPVPADRSVRRDVSSSWVATRPRRCPR